MRTFSHCARVSRSVPCTNFLSGATGGRPVFLRSSMPGLSAPQERIANVALLCHNNTMQTAVKTLKIRVKDKQARAIMTRAEAKSAGLLRYFSGKACKNGHVAERQTSNGTCIVCLAEKKARYYAENPEKRKHHNATYYAKNADYVKALNADWRAENADEMLAIRRRHYENNKGIYISRARARKEHIKQATPLWADIDAIAAIYCEARRVTEQTGVSHDVDHIIPLRGVNVCGLHVTENLQILPATINRGKDNNPRWSSECGTVHDRDVNAARNILAAGHCRLAGGIPCH